jgi:hypothetical protein
LPLSGGLPYFVHRRGAESAKLTISLDLPLRGRQVKNNKRCAQHNSYPIFLDSILLNMIYLIGFLTLFAAKRLCVF